MFAEGIIANDTDIAELNRIPDKFKDCGAQLIYLDLAGCSFVDSRIVSPIVKLANFLDSMACGFEVRVSDERLYAFFTAIELDKIVKIEKCSANAASPKSAEIAA